MPKNKNVAVMEPPPTSLQEHGGGGNPKKKKKKKKSESQEDEAVTTSQSFSFPSLSGLSPRKKKKKKEEEELVLNASINGGFEKEEEMGTGKKKKKKKKKKKEEQEEEEEKKKITLVQEELNNIEEKEIVSKKKKKVKEDEIDQKKKSKTGKKRRQEEDKQKETNVDSSPKKKAKKEKMTSPSAAAAAAATSPTKREMKAEVIDEEINMNFEVDEVWPEEVTKELLSRVISQLPNRDSRSARVRLKAMDWEAAAVPGRSPQACQDHFMALFKKINAYKNLRTMVEEMSQLSEMTDIRKRPLLPKFRYLRNYFTAELKEEAKKKGVSMLILGNQAWKDLPAEKKEQYIRPYEEECSRQKLSNPQKAKPAIELPKLPYQLCWEMEKEAAGTLKNSRTYYASLTPSKQLPYIKKALMDAMKYETDLQSHMASYPDYQPSTCHAVSKTDLKTYLDVHELPVMPPLNAALVYWEELDHRQRQKLVVGKKNKLTEAMKLFKNLSPQEKEKYKEKLKQGLLQYEEQVNEWLGRQNEMVLYAFKKYREMVPFTKPVKQKKINPVKADDFFPHKVPADTSCPKFLAEPPRPPVSPYRLFAIKFRSLTDKSLSGPEMQRAQRDGWKVLSEEEKAVYVARCHSLHQLYEKDLKAYVREMDPKTRKLFLGFNRVPLYRFFNNRDVFAEEFPHSEKCPVLVKGVKDPHHPASPHKHAAEDEDEDEEQDMVSPALSPKKRKLSPLLFSDLMAPPSPQKTFKALPHHLSEEETDDEEEQFTSALHSTTLYTTQAKKKTPVPSKKSKAPPLTPAHESESESSDEEETVVAPAWRSGPPTPLTPAQPKKKAPAPSKKSKAPPVTQAHGSEDESSEEEEDAATPAWRSGPPAPSTLAKKKQKKEHDSSSSGFSDSDSSN